MNNLPDITDDANAHGYSGCEPFGPADIDWEGQEYDDRCSGYKCGHGEFHDIPCCCDWEGNLIPGHPGCRHCNPPDYEGKPYGFGFETFEHEPSLRLARELQANWPLACGGELDRLRALELGRLWAGFDYRLLNRSNRVWDRLCGVCDTHTEALAKYEAWAARAMEAGK